MKPHDIQALLDALERPGGVVLYPTETVYGLGGRAGDSAAAHRIARIKGRPLEPLIVLINALPETASPRAKWLAERFWPGPLTLLIPSWEAIAAEVCAPDGTVGVRFSPHAVAQAIVQAVGPITSTSANHTGMRPAQDFSDLGALIEQVDAAYDGGLLHPSAPSTIVNGQTGEIIREGAISRSALEAALADFS